mgnify:CR=1 FL=1
MSGGLLCLMGMLSTNDNVKVLINGAAKAVLWKHTANGILHQTFWRALQNFLSGAAVLTTWVTRVTDVLLVIPLVACQLHLFGVDHNHKVTTIRVRSEVHLVLASEKAGDFRTKTAQTLPFGIDQQPFLVGVLLIDGDGFVAQRIHCASKLINPGKFGVRI